MSAALLDDCFVIPTGSCMNVLSRRDMGVVRKFNRNIKAMISLMTLRVDLYKPLRFDTTKIGADVIFEGSLGIYNH